MAWQPEISVGSPRHFQQKNEQGREIQPCGAIPFMDGLICVDGSPRNAGMIIKKGKNPRLVWDGTTNRRAYDVMMNDITPIHK